MPQYTRANTAPGSPERKQVYAREYAARTRKSEQETGLSYDKQRQLRELYPVPEQAKSKLRRKYSLTPTEHKAVKVISGVPNVPGTPVEHLWDWYARLGTPFTDNPGERWAEAVERSQDLGGWGGALSWEP